MNDISIKQLKDDMLRLRMTLERPALSDIDIIKTSAKVNADLGLIMIKYIERSERE